MQHTRIPHEDYPNQKLNSTFWLARPWLLPVMWLHHGKVVLGWCKLPYPGHPVGCPNAYKPDKMKCPPQAPYITDVLNVFAPVYLVFSEFDLAGHVERMRKAHPEWTERQLRNVLYWQPTSRNQAMERALEVAPLLGCDYIDACPEGKGVNVFSTCRNAGVILEKTRSLKTCHHVVLLGTKKIFDNSGGTK